MLGNERAGRTPLRLAARPCSTPLAQHERCRYHADMILDLHTHSVKSDDGRAKVRNYCQWIRSRNIPIDGFVLTEHRQFDAESDYGELALEFDLTILKASEVETEYGHVLVFGVNDALRAAFDFRDIHLPLAKVLDACMLHDAIAVPCHPGRKRVGMAAHLDTLGVPAGVRIVETLNGGSRAGEDDIAQAMAQAQGYLGIGGSDAHIVSHIGRCATRFPAPVNGERELVEALRAEEFSAVSFKTSESIA
jgi:predicted metal-dependent phosphoesterase TrpH